MTSKSVTNDKRISNVQPSYTCPVESCRVQYAEKMFQYGAYQNKEVSDTVPIGDIHEIPKSVTSSFKNKASNFYFRHLSPTYKVEDNKGINRKDARDVDVCLAKYSQKVADSMDVSSTCYTGAKHALWASGILSDYADMPRGSASNSIPYFDSNPDKFEKVDVDKSKLKSLPAGYIAVYSKEGTDGHIAITNGNGQEMSDCTDNMAWLEKHGKDAKVNVYKLTDNWRYNPITKKLEFVKPKKS